MVDSAHRWTWERALRERSATEGLTPTAQHVALMMATYADPQGRGVYPSIKTLCTATGRGRSTVAAALKELRELGWIHQTRKGSNFNSTSSQYELSIPGSSGLDPNKP